MNCARCGTEMTEQYLQNEFENFLGQIIEFGYTEFECSKIPNHIISTYGLKATKALKEAENVANSAQ